jgi:hypothetical protein
MESSTMLSHENILLRSKVKEIIENSINLFERKSKLIYKEMDNLRKECLDQLYKLNDFLYKGKLQQPSIPRVSNGSNKSKTNAELNASPILSNNKSIKRPQPLQFQNSPAFKSEVNKDSYIASVLNNQPNSSMIIRDLSRELKKISSSKSKIMPSKKQPVITTNVSYSNILEKDKKSFESTPKSVYSYVSKSTHNTNKLNKSSKGEKINISQTNQGLTPADSNKYASNSSNNLTNLSNISNMSNISSNSIIMHMQKPPMGKNKSEAKIETTISQTNKNQNLSIQNTNHISNLTDVRKFSIMDIPVSSNHIVEPQQKLSNNSLINPLNLTNNSLSKF